MPWATRGPDCVSYGFSRSPLIIGNKVLTIKDSFLEKKMYQIIMKLFFRGLCDCPPASLYTCGRCDEVLPPDQLGKALNVLHESCRNNNVRVHV